MSSLKMIHGTFKSLADLDNYCVIHKKYYDVAYIAHIAHIVPIEIPPVDKTYISHVECNGIRNNSLELHKICCFSQNFNNNLHYEEYSDEDYCEEYSDKDYYEKNHGEFYDIL